MGAAEQVFVEVDHVFVRFALDMERRNGEFLLRFSHLGAPMTLARRCAASMVAKKVD